MELKRKIYQSLLDWKETYHGKNALLIEGARRVGKSTIIERFGKREYRSCLIISFDRPRPGTKEIFNDELNDLDVFFQHLSLLYNVPLYPRKSLIVFDEVQKFSKARESLKYLVQDGRYDYVETGSLVSIKENVKGIVIPSEEHPIAMYPLDFEEFLWAAGQELLADYIHRCYKEQVPLPETMHKKAMRLFREYLLVGGMPQSVVAYFGNHLSFEKADLAKRDILSLYQADIAKADAAYRLRAKSLFNQIPGFLSRHNKEIVFSQIDSTKQSSQMQDALFWLSDSKMVNLCYACRDPNVGLALAEDPSSLKCYLADTGLLVSLAFSENEIASQQLYKEILLKRLSLNEGMLYENAIAQMLTALGHRLFFYTHYSKERHVDDIEIDFLITNESKTKTKLFPIEVKSSKNYTTLSFDAFRERFGKRVASSYVIHPKPYVKEDWGERLPPYMVMCLRDPR